MGGRGTKGRSQTPPAPQPLDENLYVPPDTPPEENVPTDTAPEQDNPGGLENRVQDAYRELSVKSQDWVRLSKLREKLGNPDRDEVDRILLTMIRTGMVHLAPDSNRKLLTEADHAAAVRFGSEDRHLIAIEPEFFETRADQSDPRDDKR